MLKTVSFERGRLRVTDEHSNEEKFIDEELLICMWSRMRKAVPPPRLEEQLIDFFKRGKLRREKPGGVASIS